MFYFKTIYYNAIFIMFYLFISYCYTLDNAVLLEIMVTKYLEFNLELGKLTNILIQDIIQPLFNLLPKRNEVDLYYQRLAS